MPESTVRTGHLRKVYVFYHYLFPDDVVSSIHFSELCAGLVKRGWDVTAFPCNRACRTGSDPYPLTAEFDGVKIERIWRPDWRQSSGIGRVLNAAWMIARWSLLAAQRQRNPDVVIVGTDPILSVLVAIAWRFFKPKTILANWCFDLYPEAAFAEGLLNRNSLPARLMQRLLKSAYRACDLVVDIGPCMGRLLQTYNASQRVATIVPWALEEPMHALPICTTERTQLFGSSSFGLLYSGSFGRPHSHEPLLSLARLLRHDDVSLAFSVRGNREKALREATLPEDSNIRFAPFTATENLAIRLASADVHVVTLREEWTGTVVPSKFFGALAIGRPVLFCGDRDSAVAQWIEEFGLGWVLTSDNIEQVAASIRELLRNPHELNELGERCNQVYQAHFSRELALEAWHQQLTGLLALRDRPDVICAEA